VRDLMEARRESIDDAKAQRAAPPAADEPLVESAGESKKRARKAG
jgi:hypothetical protein